MPSLPPKASSTVRCCASSPGTSPLRAGRNISPRAACASSTSPGTASPRGSTVRAPTGSSSGADAANCIFPATAPPGARRRFASIASRWVSRGWRGRTANQRPCTGGRRGCRADAAEGRPAREQLRAPPAHAGQGPPHQPRARSHRLRRHPAAAVAAGNHRRGPRRGSRRAGAPFAPAPDFAAYRQILREAIDTQRLRGLRRHARLRAGRGGSDLSAGRTPARGPRRGGDRTGGIRADRTGQGRARWSTAATGRSTPFTTTSSISPGSVPRRAVPTRKSWRRACSTTNWKAGWACSTTPSKTYADVLGPRGMAAWRRRLIARMVAAARARAVRPGSR